jgi:hypothetical protein
VRGRIREDGPRRCEYSGFTFCQLRSAIWHSPLEDSCTRIDGLAGYAQILVEEQASENFDLADTMLYSLCKTTDSEDGGLQTRSLSAVRDALILFVRHVTGTDWAVPTSCDRGGIVLHQAVGNGRRR